MSSEKYEKEVAEQLGMSHIRAVWKLHSMITFDHICRLDLNQCFYCGNNMSQDDHTFGHRTPWFTCEDKGKAFFHLPNVVFSHVRCNRIAIGKNRPLGQGSQRQLLASQLGITYKTAAHRRMKQIRFWLAQRLGQDFCFRCHKQINIGDFSVDHEVDWFNLVNAREIFFDLDHISFSHQGCNSRASRGNPKHACPSVASYKNGCRCNGCKKVGTEYTAKMYQKHRDSILAKKREYQLNNKEAISIRRKRIRDAKKKDA